MVLELFCEWMTHSGFQKEVNFYQCIKIPPIHQILAAIVDSIYSAFNRNLFKLSLLKLNLTSL